ncbi:3-phosphoshikimate 1-carboxyvinyltransferase [Sediminibacillus massiliensis]|uniref:3-phosphoshikimate 1-carboxyvinyltransferase n=1 Tax=Sediminibacillus massiliensis TaxID=1926277 RepID=UPI0009885DB4|nr:3-phosphoshikimate 1-carboxyvinyltransferase [Sediminibacillus massiliensis]
MTKTLKKVESSLHGKISVPGDKSISHRAVIFGSLAEGKTEITGFLDGEDCMRTIDAFEALGVKIEKDEQSIIIHGNGVSGLKEPERPIYLGNSGTTARLIMGVLAGLPFHCVLHGDESLSNRPMDRITVPLRKMGANIDGREEGKYLPISIRGGNLRNIQFQSPVKSAQVKSGVLLAGLLADGKTEVKESAITRDHTERMLQAFGGMVSVEEDRISIDGKQSLRGANVQVPGDISSASFFLVAAAIVEKSHVTLENVGLNQTRTGILDVLKKMGASIQVKVKDPIGGEPIGDITVSYAPLKGTVIEGDIIPRLIDELPVVALLATQAEGETIIRDAEELRYKETDRIAAVVETLKTFGADISGTEDGMIINGKTELSGAKADSYGDHRIGMMIAIASLIAKGEVQLTNPECINISYPEFFDDLAKISSTLS